MDAGGMPGNPARPGGKPGVPGGAIPGGSPGIPGIPGIPPLAACCFNEKIFYVSSMNIMIIFRMFIFVPIVNYAFLIYEIFLQCNLLERSLNFSFECAQKMLPIL